MANFSASNLIKAQARIQSMFTEAERRTKVSPALTLAMKNLSILIPSHEVLRTREDRPVSGYMLTRSKRAATTQRTYNHTGVRGDSKEIPFTWQTTGDKFTISLKQMDNNIFGFEETLAAEIYNACLNIHEDIETKLLDYLLTNKTQVNNATKNGTWSAENHAFEIAADDKGTFYQRLKSMMRQNNYRGTYDIIADSLLSVAAEQLAAQGAGNATNTAFQFAGLNIAESIELTDDTYENGVVLAMPAGGYALQPWMPRQNRMGHGDYNSYVGGYGSIADPMGSGLQFAVHGYTQRADTSDDNGSEQDDVLEMEITMDFSPALMPVSVENETVVFEVAQV